MSRHLRHVTTFRDMSQHDRKSAASKEMSCHSINNIAEKESCFWKRETLMVLLSRIGACFLLIIPILFVRLGENGKIIHLFAQRPFSSAVCLWLLQTVNASVYVNCEYRDFSNGRFGTSSIVPFRFYSMSVVSGR